ncbi:hypothetical protein Zmor_025845 [Zophobas morio]|uniref:Uncharacterized protein n=1 Tax=Zophobas morio TaxID=2755281 RepID=A0AA38HS78_9CUCU|nr:hypothetical protein Zmor_025845 [Zophobas morio]
MFVCESPISPFIDSPFFSYNFSNRTLPRRSFFAISTKHVTGVGGGVSSVATRQTLTRDSQQLSLEVLERASSTTRNSVFIEEKKMREEAVYK